jgi:amino acid adenylation domain-containing protein
VLDATDGRSLRSVFLQRAEADPAHPALVVNGVVTGYGELARRARVIATAITRNGTRPAERVGVFASRNEVAYSGTLAALCSGAAFVPLNHKFPVERTRLMARRALLDAIIVDAAAAPQLRAVLDGLEVRPVVITPGPDAAIAARSQAIETIGPETLTSLEPLDPLPPVLGDDISYLLFTSGTTGEPKGVGVTHANVLHYVDTMAHRWRLTPADRCSQTFDQTFDLAVHDLFLAWASGATVYAMQPIELLAPVLFVQKHKLTHWFSVPSAAAVTIKKGTLLPGSMPSLRHSLFCGEPLPDRTAAAWQAAAPNSTVENLYGPTELTIACFSFKWDAASSPAQAVNGIVPIGRPLPGLAAMVVDDALRPVPPGEVGELLVCGPQTTPGYWQDEGRTRERFVELPISATRRKRFYRTGDRVVRTASDDYVYIGRTDNQIKVFGFRVELGDVEAALLKQHGVVQAAAVGWPLEEGRALGIVAFVCGAIDTPDALIRSARALLPDYMVPREIIVLDEMPLNANGKIDRTRLLATLTSDRAT